MSLKGEGGKEGQWMDGEGGNEEQWMDGRGREGGVIDGWEGDAMGEEGMRGRLTPSEASTKRTTPSHSLKAAVVSSEKFT